MKNEVARLCAMQMLVATMILGFLTILTATFCAINVRFPDSIFMSALMLFLLSASGFVNIYEYLARH